MVMEDIVNIISTVGFPIFCVIAMGYYINTTNKDVVDALNKNTQIIEKLLWFIEREDKDGN